MSKDIIVNIGERETRVAVLENDKLVEMHIERSERVVGSIYKCRVVNVLAALDAAFVDIGLERNAFLQVGDVLPTIGQNTSSSASTTEEDEEEEDLEVLTQEEESLPETPITQAMFLEAEPAYPSSLTEAISLGRGDLPSEVQEDAYAEAMAEVAAGETGLEVDELLLESAEEVQEPETNEGTEPRRRPNRNARPFRRSVLRQQKVKDVLKIGQELLVQVIKGSHSTKGARVSTRLSLPGRYLVLMPEGDHLGVSRKIEEARERDRLKRIGEAIRPHGCGLIIRTEAEDKTEQELRQDMDFLVKTWRQIQETAKQVKAPHLVQADLTLLSKTIRDVFGSDVDKLVIDDPAEYEKANELLERISPKLKSRIHLYDGTLPIFDKHGIENECERLLRRKVNLRSGGSIIVEETEALTVVDINSSKATGSSSLTETILKTNIEAAEEIARQLRLRDIGGIIVIDFIDMNNARDKQAVIKALETALKRDRARTKISNISPLGLVEMTRKRTGETLTSFITDECPYCKGRGHLASAESVSFQLERALRRHVNQPQNARREAFLITCHPDVAELIIGPNGDSVAMLERELQRALFVRAEIENHIEDYQITGADIGELEKNQSRYSRAQVVECQIVRSQLRENGQCIGWTDGFLLDLENGGKFVGQKAKARIIDVRRSFAVAQVIPGTNRAADAPSNVS
jgi:ribonuclease G